jgi:hypothetical protein
LVNETSLLGLQLLAQFDHTLHVAKERPNLWFGGITLILSGDFFQYPPVGGTTLYTPISHYARHTDDEVQRWLGCLAWKTINMVVMLTEKQRMKGNSAYGEAVSQLRVRQCTYEDMELFNSHVIHSSLDLTGVDMGAPKNIDAAVIVATNNLREVVNKRKAEVSCGPNRLVSGYALDKCSHRSLTLLERQSLLRLNFGNTKHSNLQALPGMIPLYVGMPVILCMRNISTDLGITNGSQGTVHHIVTAVCPTGLTYVKCAIVHFPDSKVQLTELPEKHFPIIPVSWIFTTLLLNDEGLEDKVRITHHQLPIQPAFAVTGHLAQGKTLPQVLVNLHKGGFAAYVAASRAQSHDGLCITQPVTLEQLNKPLPADLLREVRRFEAIEHNTYIHCGIRQGEMLLVPDAEAERGIPARVLEPSIRKPNSQARISKCRRSDSRSEPTDRRSHRPCKKKTQMTDNQMDEVSKGRMDGTSLRPQRFTAGCSWDASNWSCAYDCIFMICFAVLHLSRRYLA